MLELTLNLPETDLPRIVVIGAGFAGLTFARKMIGKPYQVVLFDKNNFHQFQPLFYQVAMAGLEPSSISFPLRKTFQKAKNVFIRVAEMESIDQEKKVICTNQGNVTYDYVVIATGAVTNYFGNEKIKQSTLGLKSVGEALNLRNEILNDFERALQVPSYDKRQALIDIVIVGGGATGVELAGSLAELKKYILPKDYNELDAKEVDIYLVQGGDQLLLGLDPKLGKIAEDYLRKMGVRVLLNARVVDIQDNFVMMKDGSTIEARKVIWAAGVTCQEVTGLPKENYHRKNRLIVNQINQLLTDQSIFVLGDAAFMESEDYPNGHPQVAQPAIQQAKHLVKNIKKHGFENMGNWKPFKYNDLGSMATVGRNKAVVQLPKFNLRGFFAWIIWLGVHLYALIGVKNRLIVMFNWIWNYFTYDQSLRLIIKPQSNKKETDNTI